MTDYPYKDNVVNGLNYLFSQGGQPTVPVLGSVSHRAVTRPYSTGIAMMAIAASKAPEQVVNVAGSIVNGLTYKQVLQAAVDFFAWSQNPDGGWRYSIGTQASDNSNTGYAVLGQGTPRRRCSDSVVSFLPLSRHGAEQLDYNHPGSGQRGCG